MRRATNDEVQVVREALRVLRAGYTTEWNGGEALGERSFSMRWPDYDERVYADLNIAHLSIAGPDCDYPANIGQVQNKPVSSASLEELSTWFSYVVRGEQFCTGHIDGFIEDGRLQAMFERLLEVAGGPSGQD